MTAQTINSAAVSSVSHPRPAFDRLVESLARGLLAWSARRASRSQFGDERMVLLRENERSIGAGGSLLGR